MIVIMITVMGCCAWCASMGLRFINIYFLNVAPTYHYVGMFCRLLILVRIIHEASILMKTFVLILNVLVVTVDPLLKLRPSHLKYVVGIKYYKI